MEDVLSFCVKFFHLIISEQAAALGHDLAVRTKVYYLSFVNR
jgi:hypothetical protein